MKRYEKLAEDIAAMISSGLLQTGERLPSVRQACQNFAVSPATVFKAYYLLENKGLVRAKEKSGYYVLHSALEQQSLQEAVQHDGDALQSTPVAVSDLVFSLLDSVSHRDIIPLGSAFPNPKLFPIQRLARSAASAIRLMDGQALIADMPHGVVELRRIIAQRYALVDVVAKVEEIIVTTGAMEALNLCLQAVTKAGDYVAIESPAFYASLQVLERLQLNAVEIPVDPKHGMDLDVLAEALNKYPIKACWSMPSFQNPTGASLSDDKKKALVALLSAHHVPLIEDDVYHELYFADSPPKPAKAFDRDGWVMHCSSFSKSLAPGYRVGWVHAGRFHQQVQRLKLMTTISPSIPAQVTLADYLQHGGYERHLRLLRQQLQQQYTLMYQAISEFFPHETQVSAPTGGYFLWVKLSEDIDSLAVFEQALAQGVSIAPGPMFSATQGFRSCIRLNYGAIEASDIRPAIGLLAEIITKLSKAVA